MNPVTPPIDGLLNPEIRLASPSWSGVVPTSSRTQNYGLRYLQKPSKNHKCEDNFVPLECLKQEKSLKQCLFGLPVETIGLSLVSIHFVFSGYHKFWYTNAIFFSIEGGKSLFLETLDPIPFL